MPRSQIPSNRPAPQILDRTHPLGTLKVGSRGRVAAVSAAHGADHGGLGHEEIARRLLEMGFVEGAPIELMHEGIIRRDPIAVRVGDTRVALRRREANAVLIELG